MPLEIPGLTISLEAGADLSTKMYHFVKLDSNGRVIAIAADTDRPVGILQNKPNALGIVAEVMVDGVSRLIGGSNLAKGAALGTTAAGRAAAVVAGTDTTKYMLGQILHDSDNDGEECSVLFDCKSPNRAA